MHIYTYFQLPCILLKYEDTDYLISKFLYGVFDNNDFIIFCDIEFFKFKEVKGERFWKEKHWEM